MLVALWLNEWESTFAFAGSGWLGGMSVIILAAAAATIAFTIVAGDQMIALIVTGAPPHPIS